MNTYTLTFSDEQIESVLLSVTKSAEVYGRQAREWDSDNARKKLAVVIGIRNLIEDTILSTGGK